MLRSLIKSNIQSSFPPQCSIVEILHCESCLSRTRAANHKDASSLGEPSTKKFIQSLYSSRHPIQELTSLESSFSGLVYKNSISTGKTVTLAYANIRSNDLGELRTVHRALPGPFESPGRLVDHLGIYSVYQTRKSYRISDMIAFANPRHCSLESQAKSSVRYTTKLANVQVPLVALRIHSFFLYSL